jgi:uncharacterized protein YjbJ (UPF0337 family)
MNKDQFKGKIDAAKGKIKEAVESVTGHEKKAEGQGQGMADRAREKAAEVERKMDPSRDASRDPSREASRDPSRDRDPMPGRDVEETEDE